MKKAVTARKSQRRAERDIQALTALFESHGYPAPHPLAGRLYSDAVVKAAIGTVEDVKVPIIVRKQTGEIVDGINRAERLCETGLPWKDVPKRDLDLPTEDDVVDCIAKCNLVRGQYNQSQMAIVAVRLGLATSRQGARTDLGKNCQKLDGISPKYLQHARYVVEHGASELVTAIMNGEINVAEAAKIAQMLSRKSQTEIYHAPRNGKENFKTDAGNAILAERARKLAETCAPLPNVKAPVVYIDPALAAKRESPFNYRDTSYHYPVNPATAVEKILGEILADDVWVFMWTTTAHRTKAERILESLKCVSVSEMIWKKILPGGHFRGLGRVVRNTHETLLIYRRGDPPLPPTNRVPDSVIEAAVEEHSKKPDVFRDIIIAMTPNLGPRLELFARGTAYPGFFAWGNEVKKDDETENNTSKLQKAA